MSAMVARLFALLVCTAAVVRAAPDEQAEIQQLYRRGLGGDTAAVKQCIAKLEGALQKDARNQLARVYLGSAYTLRSRDLGFGPGKLRALKHGLALMDEAVDAAPQEPKVRLARALTTSVLPAFFGRGAATRADFLLLAESAEKAPAKLEAGDLEIIFYNAGLAASSSGNSARAKALWQEALRQNADEALHKKIGAELAKAP